MEKRKSILSGSLVAGALMVFSGFTANAAGMFNYNNLGSGEEVRTNLLNTNGTAKNLELKCSSKTKTDSTMKKGKDGKCGEGKCGDKKSTKKGKDGSCGASKKK